MFAIIVSHLFIINLQNINCLVKPMKQIFNSQWMHSLVSYTTILPPEISMLKLYVTDGLNRIVDRSKCQYQQHYLHFKLSARVSTCR